MPGGGVRRLVRRGAAAGDLGHGRRLIRVPFDDPGNLALDLRLRRGDHAENAPGAGVALLDRLQVVGNRLVARDMRERGEDRPEKTGRPGGRGGGRLVDRLRIHIDDPPDDLPARGGGRPGPRSPGRTACS